MTDTSVYCTAPWTSITVRENGNVLTCCAGKTIIGNLNQDKIENIVKSKNLQNIRNTMIQNTFDYKNCKFCVDLETQTGVASLRTHYNTHYPINNINSIELNFLDIRWNNTCNLTCMYCKPAFSSSWSDRLKINIQSSQKEYQSDLLTWILDRVDNIKEIMLVGGEPLLMKQNVDLLKKLPQDCRISFITNLSYDLEKNACFEHLINRPKDNIIWNVSMDNVRDQFEYVRNGARWKQVVANFKTLQTHWPNTISINLVYSLFNAFNLKQIVQEYHALNVKKFNFFTINDHPAFDIYNMSPFIKKLALKNLNEVNKWHTNKLHPEDRELYQLVNIKQLIDFLDQHQNIPAKVNKRQVLDQIEKFDQWADKKFSELWPDVVALLENHM